MADDSAAHKGVEFIQEVWGLAGVSIFVSALRLYQRISTTGFKGLTLDDYLMIFTTVSYRLTATFLRLSRRLIYPSTRYMRYKTDTQIYRVLSHSNTIWDGPLWRIGGALQITQ